MEGDVGGGQEAAEVEQIGGGRARTVSQVEVEGSTPKVKPTFGLVLVTKSFFCFTVLEVFSTSLRFSWFVPIIWQAMIKNTI